MKEKILYTVSRIGIMLMADVVCSILSITLVTWIVNFFVSGSGGSFKETLFENGGIWSLVSWIMVFVIMLILFVDDGVKHSAYESYDLVSEAIIFLLIFAVYFIPVTFIGKTTGKTETGFKGFYFPNKWIAEKFSLDYVTATLIGISIILIVCFIAYIISHAVYMKRHPVLDWRVKNPNEEYASKD